jgi:predicted phosphodiesterase
MRIAALADIHGNLRALRAFLAEVDREAADALVIAGDVVAGPLVRESLELLRARPEAKRWIRGNSEREAVSACDGAPTAEDAVGQAARWSANALSPRWRDELAFWPITIALDGVRFATVRPAAMRRS